MKKLDAVMLAARTARTNAYVQAIAQGDLRFKGIILFGSDSITQPGQTAKEPERNWPNSPVFLPDLSIPLDEAVKLVSDNIIQVSASHVNDKNLSSKLVQLQPELIVYSGYGSQIVGSELISHNIPILHIHSGWLPDFRGSTTTYFHLLVTGYCGVSALLLNKSIDTGPVVARKKYPSPPQNVDIDYLYDSAIRADLLLEILTEYSSNKEFSEKIYQHEDEGNTYYIIHPVLKHIAMLSLE